MKKGLVVIIVLLILIISYVLINYFEEDVVGKKIYKPGALKKAPVKEIEAQQILKPSQIQSSDKTSSEYKKKLESEDIIKSESSKNYKGYIIEFKKEPIAKYKVNLEKSSSKIITNAIDSKLVSYKEEIDNEHIQAKKTLASKLKITQDNFNKKTLNEYKNVLNGIALDINDNEAKLLEKSSYIKRVYPNYEVKATLQESIPLIEANEVWKLNSNNRICITYGGSGECLTGKGIKIGIIDTGIDTSHIDLGASYLRDRDFDKITQNPLVLDRYGNPNDEIEPDQSISMNQNRLAYYSDNKIYLFYFEDDSTREIKLPSNDLKPLRLILRDNFLAYYARDESYNAYLYLYDINTDKHTKINKVDTIGSISISNEKLVYSRHATPTPIDDPDNQIYLYDIKLKQEIAIADQSSYVYMPLSYKNFVVYPIPSDICYKKAIIYDIDKSQSFEITPPDIGPILDFKNDEILYVACSKTNFDPRWRHYYVYNISTGEYKLLYTEGGMLNSQPDIQNSDNGYALYSWISKGKISNNLIHISKDVDTDQIVTYDTKTERYVKINLYKKAGYFDAEENRICFIALDHHIYCHNYDANKPYIVPNIFNRKVVDGYDFVDDDSIPYDFNGHGTHVAGIAAGKGDYNNDNKWDKDTEIWGVAPDANIIAYRVLNSDGRGYLNWIISAIEKSLDPNQDGDFSDHIDVISLSLGGFGDSNDPMALAIDNAIDNGIVAVVAAGNSGPGGNPYCRHTDLDLSGLSYSICSPGTARKAITIGATYKKDYEGRYWEDLNPKKDKIVSFSSRGPTINEIIKPDIVAPGALICSALKQDFDRTRTQGCLDDNHFLLAGTSMATPMVSGAVALIKQAHPNWGYNEILNELKRNAKNLGYDINIQGNGRLNLIDTQKPKVTLLQPINQEFNINQQITFRCNVQDNVQLSKTEFWLTEPGKQFYLNEVKNINKQVDQAVFYKQFNVPGNYAWNCKAFDTSGNYAYGNVSDISPGFIVNQLPSCNDGTTANTCSLTKPKYCSYNSNTQTSTLINICQKCGCNTGFFCNKDGKCIKGSSPPIKV